MPLTTPETSGASEIACRLADWILSMDAFRGQPFDRAALAAAVALRIDGMGIGRLVLLARDLRARNDELLNALQQIRHAQYGPVSPDDLQHRRLTVQISFDDLNLVDRAIAHATSSETTTPTGA